MELRLVRGVGVVAAVVAMVTGTCVEPVASRVVEASVEIRLVSGILVEATVSVGKSVVLLSSVSDAVVKVGVEVIRTRLSFWVVPVASRVVDESAGAWICPSPIWVTREKLMVDLLAIVVLGVIEVACGVITEA